MIEARIRRALWAVSVLVALGFGGRHFLEESIRSLAAAAVVPLALWAIYFLFRWIWTGETYRQASARQPLSKNARYLIVGVFGFLVLFITNVLILPPGKAVQVLVSSVFQALLLGAAAWIFVKVRGIIERRASRRKQNEAPPS